MTEKNMWFGIDVNKFPVLSLLYDFVGRTGLSLLIGVVVSFASVAFASLLFGGSVWGVVSSFGVFVGLVLSRVTGLVSAYSEGLLVLGVFFNWYVLRYGDRRLVHGYYLSFDEGSEPQYVRLRRIAIVGVVLAVVATVAGWVGVSFSMFGSVLLLFGTVSMLATRRLHLTLAEDAQETNIIVHGVLWRFLTRSVYVIGAYIVVFGLPFGLTWAVVWPVLVSQPFVCVGYLVYRRTGRSKSGVVADREAANRVLREEGLVDDEESDGSVSDSEESEWKYE